MIEESPKDKVQRLPSSGLISRNSDVKSTTPQKNAFVDFDIEEDREVENKPLGGKSKSQLQLAPPGPRRPGTDPPITEGVARKGRGAASSISSWEERLPEPDEESETWTAQSEPPLSRPGAHCMPGINGCDHDDEMTADNADPVSPSGDSLVYAEAIKTPQIVEAQEFQDTPPGGFCSIPLRTRVIVIGFPLLVIVGLVIGLVLGLGKDPAAMPSPAISQIPGNWTQIGEDLVGEASDDDFGLSVALSGDGSILAVGAPGNDNNGNYSGKVYAYQQNLDGTGWIGLALDGAADEFDWFGTSVSLSDEGPFLAVGAPQLDADGNPGGPGYVLVFQLVDSTWAPIGNPIIGRSEGDAFGASVALSADGTALAVFAYGGIYTAVYNLRNGNWTQVGSDISGEAWSILLSQDGTVLAAGDFSGDLLRVYRLVDSQQWTLVGDALGGENLTSHDSFGFSVSLSAHGTVVAVGAPANNGNDSTASNRGAVYVYQNVNNDWRQVGSDLFGANPGDWFGLSVSLSDDGTVLAVGAIFNDSNGDNSGQVRVFQLVDNEWRPIGDPINGWNTLNGNFGTSVALSADGTIVAGGAAWGDNPYNYVLVYRLEDQ